MYKVPIGLNFCTKMMYSYLMRLLIWICFFCFGLALSPLSIAQDKNVKAEPRQETSPKEAGKPEERQTENVDEAFDIDEFFKQGEENAKNGSSCHKAPEPVA